MALQMFLPLAAAAAIAAPAAVKAPADLALHDVLTAAGAPPIYALAYDAIRVSSAPALGGKAYVIEVHRLRDRSAEGTAVWLDGHPRLGWKRLGESKIRLTAAQYDTLAGDVDGALAPAQLRPEKPDELIVCSDGPGWVTERSRQSTIWTLSGSCGGNHPNARIQKAMRQLFPDHRF